MSSSGMKWSHLQAYVICQHFPSPPVCGQERAVTGEGSLGKQRCLACGHFSSWPQMVKLHLSYISLLEKGVPAPSSPLAARSCSGLALVHARPFPKPTLLTSTAQIWPAEKKWLGPRNWIHSMKGPINTRSGANPGDDEGMREEQEQSRGKRPHVPQGQWALRSAQKLVAPNWPSET